MCCRCGTKQPDTSNSCSTNRSLQIFAVKSTTAGHVQLAGKHTTCMLPNRSRPYCVHPTLSSSKFSSFHTLVLTRVNTESPVADRLNIHSEPTIGTRFSARNTHKPRAFIDSSLLECRAASQAGSRSCSCAYSAACVRGSQPTCGPCGSVAAFSEPLDPGGSAAGCSSWLSGGYTPRTLGSSHS